MFLTNKNLLKLGFEKCPHLNGYRVFFANKEIDSIHLLNLVDGAYTKVNVIWRMTGSVFDEVEISTLEGLDELIHLGSGKRFTDLDVRKSR